MAMNETNMADEPFPPREPVEMEQIMDFRPAGVTRLPDEGSELAQALALAKARIGPIPRSKTVKVATRGGGSYTFKYAPLEVILAVVTPALSQYNIAMLQDTDWGDGRVAISTTLVHASGETVTLARMEAPVTVSDGERDRPMTLQEIGSVLTYLRRYSVTTALCIASDDDDDGNAASGNSMETLKEASYRAAKTPQHLIDAINSVTTMDGLADLWNSFTPEEKTQAAEAKDARKYLIAKGE
jgi:hypothetical protein